MLMKIAGPGLLRATGEEPGILTGFPAMASAQPRLFQAWTRTPVVAELSGW